MERRAHQELTGHQERPARLELTANPERRAHQELTGNPARPARLELKVPQEFQAQRGRRAPKA